MSNDDKHFAFILDVPRKGEFLMFPGFYEDLKEYIDLNYDERTDISLSDITTAGWGRSLIGHKNKIFILKTNNNE